jgi:hypothetical protein
VLYPRSIYAKSTRMKSLRIALIAILLSATTASATVNVDINGWHFLGLANMPGTAGNSYVSFSSSKAATRWAIAYLARWKKANAQMPHPK